MVAQVGDAELHVMVNEAPAKVINVDVLSVGTPPQTADVDSREMVGRLK